MRNHRKQVEKNMCKLQVQMCWNSKGIFTYIVIFSQRFKCRVCRKLKMFISTLYNVSWKMETLESAVSIPACRNHHDSHMEL